MARFCSFSAVKLTYVCHLPFKQTPPWSHFLVLLPYIHPHWCDKLGHCSKFNGNNFTSEMFQCSCDSGKTVRFQHILQTGTLKSLFVCESVSAIQTLQIKPCLQKCVCARVFNSACPSNCLCRWYPSLPAVITSWCKGHKAMRWPQESFTALPQGLIFHTHILSVTYYPAPSSTLCYTEEDDLK